MFYIYKITNTKNGKIYIGKSKNVDSRWRQHVYDSRSKPTYFGRAICKYGEDAFEKEIIDSHESEEVAYTLEKYWIDKLGSTKNDIGYNLAEGGRGGFCGIIPSEAARKKRSEISKLIARKPHTEQEKQKIKEARKKQKYKRLNTDLKNQILGMYRTNNYTKQQVADRLGIGLGTVKSVVRKGVGLDKFLPCKKISRANIGKKPGPLSEEHKAKISAALKKRYEVPMELKDNIIKDFNNLLARKEIAKKHRISVDCVDRITTGMVRACVLIGRVLSEEHKEKISKGNIGKVCSDEAKEKISVANFGEGNGMYGRTHSDDTKARMSKKQSERVRLPVTEEQKQMLSLKFKGKPRPALIPSLVRENVRKDYATGNFTKGQLSEKHCIKYGSVVNILRKRYMAES